MGRPGPYIGARAHRGTGGNVAPYRQADGREAGGKAPGGRGGADGILPVQARGARDVRCDGGTGGERQAPIHPLHHPYPGAENAAGQRRGIRGSHRARTGRRLHQPGGRPLYRGGRRDAGMHAPGPALRKQGEMRGRDRRGQRPPGPDRCTGAGDRHDANRREQPLHPHLRRAGKPRTGQVPPANRNLLHQRKPAEESAED